MKIISKYKDYYDYLSGIYGIDPLIVYDRRNANTNVHVFSKDYLESRTFHICGMKYKLHYYKGEIYHTIDEIIELNTILKIDNKELLYGNNWMGDLNNADYYFNYHNGISDLNIKFGEPVLVPKMYNSTKYELLILSNYGLSKYISPNDMFKNIYSFLSKLKDIDIPNNQTDIEKVISHGFDKITSFRNMK